MQFHNRPMLLASVGAVLAAAVGLLLPKAALYAICAVLVPATVFLFHRRNTGFLLPLFLTLVLLRIAWIPQGALQDGGVGRFLTGLRGTLQASADSLFGDAAASAKGILLGDTSDLGDAERARYAASGLLHLFAVSGLHVSLLVGTLSRTLRTRNRILNLCFLSVILLFFCAVTGFSASVLRAAFMLISIEISHLRDKQVDGPSVFCFAMALTLLYDPYSLFRAGFQLSFAAAFGLILFGKAFRKPFNRVFPNSRSITALSSSAAAMVGMLPVMASHFGEVAWISIPLSILLIPIMPIILLFGFFAILIEPILPGVAAVLSYPASGAIRFIMLLTSVLDIPTLRLPQPHWSVMVLYYIGLILCSRLYLRNAKQPPWIGLSVLMASIILWFVL